MKAYSNPDTGDTDAVCKQIKVMTDEETINKVHLLLECLTSTSLSTSTDNLMGITYM